MNQVFTVGASLSGQTGGVCLTSETVSSRCGARRLTRIRRSEFGFGRRKFASDDGISERARAVRAIAEWLVSGLPATAEADYGAARQAEDAAFGIHDLEIPLDAQGAVVIYGDAGCGQVCLQCPAR